MIAMTKKIPCIYTYSDFRHFLDEYQKTRYSYDKTWSRIKLCRRLGLQNSRSYYTDVIKGKKVTASFIERFVELFEFDNQEAHYFRVLVKFSQADSSEERQLYFEQLISLIKVPKEIIDPDQHEYYRFWYHSVVRGLLDIVSFSDNYDSLLELIYPQISREELQNSIKLLTRLGMIKQDSRGIYRVTNQLITSGKTLHKELVKGYQLQILDLTKQAVFDNDSRPKEFTTKLISLSEDGFHQIKNRYNKFLDEVSSIANNDLAPADRLYHLNVQVFPAAIAEDL